MQVDKRRYLNIYNQNINYFHNKELNILFRDNIPHNCSVAIQNELDAIVNDDHFSIFVFIILRALYVEFVNISNELQDAGRDVYFEWKNYPFKNIDDFYFGLRYSNNCVHLDLRNIELAHIVVDEILLHKLYWNSIEALLYIHFTRIHDNLINKLYYKPDFYLHEEHAARIFISSGHNSKVKVHSINEILDFESSIYSIFQKSTQQTKEDTQTDFELQSREDVRFHAKSAENRIFESQMIMYMMAGKNTIESERLAREECNNRVEIAKKLGLYFTPPNLGELIFSNQEIKDSRISSLINNVRKRLPYLESEGVTKQDIITWWNIHYLERQKMIDDDMIIQFARVLTDIDELENLDHRSKIVNYKKFMPTFSEDSNDLLEDNPLPVELKIRVIQYSEKNMLGSSEYRRRIQEKLEKHMTYNSLVRSEIKNGNL